MLQIVIPDTQFWDESKEEFVYKKGQTLQLEHSLVSLAKWESKWCKRFLSKEEKTTEETIDYIRCMTITQNVNPEVYENLTRENIEAVNAYISAPMTATYISSSKNSPGSKEPVTAELIYYWMISLNIPFKCEKWHLNRLITLIQVCNVKNQPPKKMSKKARASQYATLNAARRKQFNTTG